MLTTQIFILVILILLSGFFSGVEVALMSLNNIKVRSLAKQKKKGSFYLKKIKKDPHRLIITILIGNNLVNIAAASIATIVFTNIFGSAAIGISTGIMTLLILVFGEIIPKTYASQNAVFISLKVSRLIYILSLVLFPLIIIFEFISKFIFKISGSQKIQKMTEAELEAILSIGKEQGVLEKEVAHIVANMLKFGERKVQEIMTPRVDLALINGNKKVKEVLDYITKTPYSRYPVYIDNPNKIEGIIDIDDILKVIRDRKYSRKVKDIIRPVLFIPRTKDIDDLLNDFEGKEVPMAIVVDEFGDLLGLVTVEDILEEIVGDIFDKSKLKSLRRIESRIHKKDINIDAKTSIDELNKSLNLGLKKEYFNTIGGYIVDRLGRVPYPGERIRIKKNIIEVTKVTKRSIKRIKIIRE
jgi:putative hemolysin